MGAEKVFGYVEALLSRAVTGANKDLDRGATEQVELSENHSLALMDRSCGNRVRWCMCIRSTYFKN